MAGEQEAITISICTYDRYDVLPKAIESAARQTLSRDRYKIMVIDNSPDHDRARAFSRRFAAIPKLTYLIEPTPGLSNARNVSARLCGTPFISFMDDDAVASEGWLDEVLQAFQSFGEAAMIVGGRVDPLWGAERPPWVHDSMLGNLSVVDWGGDTRLAKPAEWFAGTNISFRTSAIAENGGFATNLGRIGSGAALLSNEEIHLLERIRAGGGQMVYAPRAAVAHLVDPRRLSRTWFRKRSAWQAVSDFMMDPDRVAREAKGQWPGMLDYFNTLPPHERTIRGLIHETDDADLFRWQLGAIYTLTTMTLAGFDGVVL
jgi:glucosyl-dolichyl phosphate glucuronosyltransferase